MKKIFYFISAVLAVIAVNSCGMDDDESNWEKYADWRTENLAWLETQKSLKNADGTYFYTKVQPGYEGSSYVLMHYFEDPSQNKDNLQPLYTSSATVNYTVRLYDGTLVDSAANFTNALNDGLIEGWAIAVQQMHVGDTAQIVMPYEVAYGSNGSGSIYPYSTLLFNIRLVDIANYETRPE
jgi:FKBP-type peptidyl-prolyl cis-trans isomerase FklB